jgi:hypothetical protein
VSDAPIKDHQVADLLIGIGVLLGCIGLTFGLLWLWAWIS